MPAGLTLARDGHWLDVQAPWLPRGRLRINYLEAYCRAGSTDADWVRHTVVPHETAVVARAADGRTLALRDRTRDGVVVDHELAAGADDVSFALTLRNDSPRASGIHWAQACVRVGAFCGFDEEPRGNLDDYLPKCFVFMGGRLARLPTTPWATQARYTPGQVWRPAWVPKTDVNPRPLNPRVPSNGLIGCFSADGTRVFATAWEPYQELFQGVARCLHSDFRVGGLAAGETKRVRGKIYLLPADIPALLARYNADFPERRD